MTKKIFLIFEDYGEMSRTQTYLKKIGFDVLAVQGDGHLSNYILTFNPDLIMAFGMQKWSSINVGQKIKEHGRYTGKVILVLPSRYRPGLEELAKIRADAMVEAPVQPTRLISLIAKVLSLEAQPLLEKFARAQAADPSLVEPSSGHMKQDKERMQRYEKFLHGISIDKKKTSHDRQAIKERQEDLIKDWDLKSFDELDRLKQEFASALFKKKS